MNFEIGIRFAVRYSIIVFRIRLLRVPKLGPRVGGLDGRERPTRSASTYMLRNARVQRDRQNKVQN
jgi:hypothetical protein